MDAWLSNENRAYVGLEPVESHWDRVDIKKGYYVYFDGDVIRKRISSLPESYVEEDVYIEVRDRQFVVPKTSRGKEKNLTYTTVSGFKAEGVTFSAGISPYDGKSYVTAYNKRNSVSLPISDCSHMTSKAEIISWLEHFPGTVPDDYGRKLDRLKNMPNQRYQAVPGDIFRVELDLHTDGYVLVIGNLRQMEKDHLFSEQSIWRSVMTMPLFVRPFLWKTTERSPSLEDILAAPMSETTRIVMDDFFFRGGYEFVYHKPLEEEDILFPIGYGPTTSVTNERVVRLSWGLGTLHKPEEQTPFRLERNFMNHGACSGLTTECFGPPSERMHEKDLAHPQYAKERKQALAEFGLSEDITYDEFCQKTGAMTRLQYIDYVKRKYRIPTDGEN
ncbi:hypothetical protein ABIE27_000964 [Paenibacillus sp. 4624]|jgi:hypothetical protein|uniref:Immunity protein 26 of polymorphic toxin system n=1 Tax=Paenibacillus amylolyticus TaxID=1451 RepID=A0A5M9WQZ4_PAEAM|nr:immunity 26/phosphotriesterase HocA family protein [Paenibacillus amylolyticus]KAA8783991.1 hypothetical protein EC604_09040 [Paenibacillus amylolyticus]